MRLCVGAALRTGPRCRPREHDESRACLGLSPEILVILHHGPATTPVRGAILLRRYCVCVSIAAADSPQRLWPPRAPRGRYRAVPERPCLTSLVLACIVGYPHFASADPGTPEPQGHGSSPSRLPSSWGGLPGGLCPTRATPKSFRFSAAGWSWSPNATLLPACRGVFDRWCSGPHSGRVLCRGRDQCLRRFRVIAVRAGEQLLQSLTFAPDRYPAIVAALIKKFGPADTTWHEPVQSAMGAEDGG